MDYVTKKIPRGAAQMLPRLKALMSLKGQRTVTEGQVMALALVKLEAEMSRERRYSVLELAGKLKFKKPVSPGEMDKIIYGV
jgi:hypothetical protein